MKLIVGLGNPGPEYQRTRHNVGFMVLDRLAARHAPGGIPRQKFGGLTLESRLTPGRGGGWGARPASDEEQAEVPVLLLKPMTYMNRSGQSVGEAVRFYKLDPATDVLVVVDEIALPAGQIRLRAKGSAGGHNGLSDIQRALGTSDYARCRVGIGPRDEFITQHDFVLGRIPAEQAELLEPAMDAATDAATLWATGGIDAAMNRYNAPASTNGDTAQNDGQ
ncbi:MAG: aminoacyl-tRNA hydrolase [Planctomycetota bacterium]